MNNEKWTYWKILDKSKKEFKKISYLNMDPEQLLVIQQTHKYIKDDIYKYNSEIYYSILNWNLFENWYNKFHGLYNNYCYNLYKQINTQLIFPFYQIFELRYKWIKLGFAIWSETSKNKIKILNKTIHNICNLYNESDLLNIWDSIENKNNINWEKVGIIIKNPYLFQELLTILNWPDVYGNN